MTLQKWMQRESIGVSALARLLLVSRQAVYGWLSGDFTPGLDHAVKLQELSDGKIAVESWLESKSGQSNRISN